MYDHNVKAGNPGDMVKHCALIAAADVLLREPYKNTFHYADIYSGYAFNPLQPDREWINGIGKIPKLAKEPESFAVKFWHDLWSCKDGMAQEAGLRGNIYPGSSLFIFKLCMAKKKIFKARLWDNSPSVVAQLMATYKDNEAEIYPRPAVIDDFSAGKQPPDLLLIDPPSASLDHFRFIENINNFNLIMWLPHDINCTFKERARANGMSTLLVKWSGRGSLKGCCLAYRLPAAASETMGSAVNELASLMDGGHVEFLD